MTAALSKTGARRLAEAEAKIERGLSTFWEVGSALMQIRDERLYRAEFGTFEDYCQERWGMTRRRANQLVEAATLGTMVPIENERQARALAPVAADPVEVRETFAEAERRGDTTSAGLARVVSERKTVTETSTTTFDPETGEIIQPAGGGDAQDTSGASGRTPDAPAEPASSPPVPPVETFLTCPTCGGSGEIKAKETAA